LYFSNTPIGLGKILHSQVISPTEAALFSRHGHPVIISRKPRQLSATGLIGEAIGERSAFLSAGFPALCARKRRPDAVALISRGHSGNDPGEGTIKARHLQYPLASVRIARFFLRQSLEVKNGTLKTGACVWLRPK